MKHHPEHYPTPADWVFLGLFLVVMLGGACGVSTAPALPTPSAPHTCQVTAGLPDHICTPGAVDPAATSARVCQPGYAASVRPPVSVTDAIKTERMAAYGLSGASPAGYELDHLVPLELGGAPADRANLWPEPWDGPLGAHAKDNVENELHRRVCSGALDLATAQRRIATNWTMALEAP